MLFAGMRSTAYVQFVSAQLETEFSYGRHACAGWLEMTVMLLYVQAVPSLWKSS